MGYLLTIIAILIFIPLMMLSACVYETLLERSNGNMKVVLFLLFFPVFIPLYFGILYLSLYISSLIIGLFSDSPSIF